MNPEYEYIDIDPANPPEMPCDAILSDQLIDQGRHKELQTEKLYGIVFIEDKPIFITKTNRWKYAKLRKEKPIDFRNRWVKIKTWAEMEREYGLDDDGDINLRPCFPKDMQEKIPKNRIILSSETSSWNGYTIIREMISEILPIDYQPERELDDTTKRLWWYENVLKDSKILSNYAYTEKEWLTLNSNIKYYAPGPIIPDEKDWRKV